MVKSLRVHVDEWGMCVGYGLKYTDFVFPLTKRHLPHRKCKKPIETMHLARSPRNIKYSTEKTNHELCCDFMLAFTLADCTRSKSDINKPLPFII